MFSIILAHIIVSLLVVFHIASYKVDVEPKTRLTTYDYVPEWIDTDDIVVPSTHTCDIEDAIRNSDDSLSMVRNIINLLSK